MKLTFRWKLLLSHLFVALLMGGVLYAYLSHTMGNYLVEESRAALLSEARLARLTTSREIGAMRRDAPSVAAAVARETRSRVTIIDRQGEVLGDSEVPPAELKELENHLQRPEVQDALHKGEGSSLRYSATLRMPMLYVAFPFTAVNGDGGILRLALPLSVLQKTRSSLHAILDRVVIHVHPVHLNAFLCARDSREKCAEVFRGLADPPLYDGHHRVHGDVSGQNRRGRPRGPGRWCWPIPPPCSSA